MATVITSIGEGTSHDENAAISAVSGAGPTYTVTIAANSSVDGDALWDEHATPRKYLIESGGGTTSLTVRDSEGTGSAPDNSGTSLSAIKRYYNGSTPVVDWESGLDDVTNLYSASDDAVGRCYNDADIAASQVTINGGGSLTSIKLTVPAGERHDGTANTGTRVTWAAGNTWTISSANVTLEWLEFEANSNGNSAISITGDNVTVSNLIIHNKSGTASLSGIVPSGVALTQHVLNCTVYDLVNTGTGSSTCFGLVHQNQTGAKNLQNNTVHDIRNDNGSGDAFCFLLRNLTDHVYQNNIATDPSGSSSGTLECYSTSTLFNTTTSHNLASDATASGTGSLDNKASADQFVSTTSGSEDLHLKNTNADAFEAGTDLGTTPTGVNIDIDSYDRDVGATTWSMGSHDGDNLRAVPLTEDPPYTGSVVVNPLIAL